MTGKAEPDPDERQDSRAPRLDDQVYVPHLLTLLSGSLTRTASQFYRAEFGIGLTDWRVMYWLETEPGITANRLCVLTGLDKGVVSRSLGWMREQGLIAVEEDERDARRRRVSLSPEGFALYERISVVALARERNFLSVLTPEEVDHLTEVLRRLCGNLPAQSRPVPIPPAPKRLPKPAVKAAEAPASLRRRATRV